MTFGFYALTHNDTNNDNVRDTRTYVQADYGNPNSSTAAHDTVTLLAKPAEKPVQSSPQTADGGLMLALCAASALLAGAKCAKKRK